MALRRSVLKEDDFFVSYTQIHVLMSSDNSDSAVSDSDSDVPTSSSLKQLQP